MKRIIHLAALISIILLAACSTDHIKVIETNFTEEIIQQQNLVFKFNEELVPATMINVWDSVEYIEFTPKVHGKFKWSATNEIIFSPSEGFKPSTEYTAKLTKDIAKQSKGKTRVSGEKFEFHTPYLKFISANAYWTISDDELQKVMVNIDLKFNYNVNPNQFKDVLDLKVKGNETTFTILTKNVTDEIRVAIPAPEVDISESTIVKITIDKSLKCVGSDWTRPDDYEDVFEIPPQDQLMVSEIIASYEEGKGRVNVYTTQPIITKDLKNFISVFPAVKYNIETLANGFLITGDFVEGDTYQVKISGKIKGIFGKTMGEDFAQYVNFGQLEPHIAFADKSGVYLSSKGERNIGVNIISIPKVKLTVFKIYANNIMHYLREGRTWDYYYDDEEGWYDFHSYPMNGNFGDEVLSKVINTDKLQRTGNTTLLNIDLNEIKYSSDYKGLYLLKVESVDKKWLQDLQLVSVSDIGLIVKQGINNIYVFANSIKDATPLAGVDIKFISSNNQEIFTATTNSEGIAICNDLKSEVGDFNISMVTAQLESDFNYLLLNQSRVETSRFDVGGKHTNSLNYDVFIYGQRNMYRPGDTVYSNIIVRTNEWETLSEMPVKVKVKLPNGREFLSIKMTLNDEGASVAKFHLPVDALTGVYNIEVYSGNDVFLNSYRFSVEEFMPDRIKVVTKIDK